MEHFCLKNGDSIPLIAYGTGVVNHYSKHPYFWAKNKTQLILSSIKHRKLNRQLIMDLYASKLVRQAYDAGIRMFDTGRIYGDSEKSIGAGLKGIPRHQYFLVTKFSDLCFQMKALPGYEANDVIGHIKKSLQFLKTDYIDLLLIHHPHGPVAEIWKQMEKALELGLCKSIGTSNFEVRNFRELEKTQRISPMVNQGERHPFFQNREVVSYCKENGIVFMAHTATGHNEANKNSTILNLSQKYGKSPQQIVLRWHYQHGIIPVVSTVNRKHMVESVDLYDFEISEKEMQQLDQLDNNMRLLNCMDGVDDRKYRYNL